MMSSEWGLFVDGRSQSDIRQGVTLEIFGEGESMGPLNHMMRAEYEKQEVDIHYAVTWRTLAEGLNTLARRSISTNIASFVGASVLRRLSLRFSGPLGGVFASLTRRLNERMSAILLWKPKASRSELRAVERRRLKAFRVIPA
jgi:hypothetical protein